MKEQHVSPEMKTTPPQSPSVRSRLLTEAKETVLNVRHIPGIIRIALIGSLTTHKPDPKDADLLVTVTDEMNLALLAKLGRRLCGHAQRFNKGGEIFLSNPQGRYIGRICHWKECGPGIRGSCDALNCGQRHYLHDDFNSVRLRDELIAAPPLELWPQIIARVSVPEDVERLLLAPLQQHVAQPHGL
ncbi:MAG: hypothetical protein AAB354_08625 [candidate division KSB1 bacterium]